MRWCTCLNNLILSCLFLFAGYPGEGCLIPSEYHWYHQHRRQSVLWLGGRLSCSQLSSSEQSQPCRYHRSRLLLSFLHFLLSICCYIYSLRTGHLWVDNFVQYCKYILALRMNTPKIWFPGSLHLQFIIIECWRTRFELGQLRLGVRSFVSYPSYLISDKIKSNNLACSVN